MVPIRRDPVIRHKRRVRVWVTDQWFVEHRDILKHIRILWADPIRQYLLVEACKFRCQTNTRT